MGLVDKALEAIDGVARTVVVALTAAIIVILCAQIFFRYVLNSSLIWSEEVGTWCMVWVVFLGAATLMRRWDHVHIPMLIQVLPMSIRPAFVIFAKAATCVAVGVLLYYGVHMVVGTFHIRSQGTGINTRWIKLAVPIGAGLMTVFALRSVIDDIRRWRRGELEYFRSYGDIGLGEGADVAAVQRGAPGS